MSTFSLRSAAALVGGLLLALSPLAELQAQPYGGYDDDGYGRSWSGSQGLPGGSWRESCRYPESRGDAIYAECRDVYNRWVRTSINARMCRGGLGNDNGRLVCEREGGWGLPGGSWRDSCRYPVMRGSDFSAQCRGRRNGWYNSSINVNYCRSNRIGNDNGRLVCEDRRRGY